MASARTHLSSFRYKAAWWYSVLLLHFRNRNSLLRRSGRLFWFLWLATCSHYVPVGEQACIVARVPTGKPRRAKQSLGNFLLDECSHLLLQKVILLEGWIQFNQFTGNRNLRLDKNVQVKFRCIALLNQSKKQFLQGIKAAPPWFGLDDLCYESINFLQLFRRSG